MCAARARPCYQREMRRRSATGLGVLLALSSLAGATAISSRMAEARREERRVYREALAAREAAAAAAGAEPPGAAGPVRSHTLCLRGAETVAARVARFLDSRPIDASGRLDVAALGRLSRRAAEVERGAALPQRMGRRRAAADAALAWLPIDPPDRICVELPDAGGGRPAHGSRGAAGAK